jgi:hypothetical protein
MSLGASSGVGYYASMSPTLSSGGSASVKRLGDAPPAPR